MTLALASMFDGGGVGVGGDAACEGGGDARSVGDLDLLPGGEVFSSFGFLPRLGFGASAGAGSGFSPTEDEAGGASGFSSG
jgi:hypothetical protein